MTDDQLFDEVLELTAGHRRDGRSLFPMRPDDREGSYYQPCRAPGAQRMVFSLGAVDVEGLRAGLHELWADTPLAAAVDDVVHAAEQARERRRTEEDDGSVPELVYAMY